MAARAYPRLFAYDFLGEKEKSAQELARLEIAAQMNAQRPTETDDNNERDLEAERQRDEEVRRKQKEANETKKEKEKDIVKEKIKPLCVRALCENEENWHPAGNPFEITEKVVIQNSASYLSRIMLLLKHSDLALEILNSDQGEIELQKIDEVRKIWAWFFFGFRTIFHLFYFVCIDRKYNEYGRQRFLCILTKMCYGL